MSKRLLREAYKRSMCTSLRSKMQHFPTLSTMSSTSFLKESHTVQPEKTVNGSAFIGLHAMKSANSSLGNFCKSYFMFHGMDVNKPEFVFKYLPILSFTESYIYQFDNRNEDVVNVDNNANSDKEPFMNAFESNPFQPLILILKNHKLLTERIRQELRHGLEYWALERKLCTALQQGVEISIKDAMRVTYLKSTDFRILNLILYQLRGVEVNELHMEFVSASEFFVEIADDLLDYEEDVQKNTYNILRMFVAIYGTSDAPSMLGKCIAEAGEKYENLSKALDPELSLNYPKRWEKDMKQVKSGLPYGWWTIPHPIGDEQLYRSTPLQSSTRSCKTDIRLEDCLFS